MSKGGEQVYNEAYLHLNKKYGDFPNLGFHAHKWCADFVSWVAGNAGQSQAIPKNSAVSGLQSAIKDAGGIEYSKASIQNGEYVAKRGDIIIFKNNESHVGIVDYQSNDTIYYIDGNNVTNGNGNNSCVHYSSRSIYHKNITCVLRPNYR